jgi:ABC-type transport system substrate-binding protein
MARESNYWTRVSRRSALRSAALAGVGLAGLAAISCGGTQQSGSTTATTSGTAEPAAKRGGTINYAILGDQLWAGFDPHILNQSYTGAMSFFYQALLRRNPKTMDPEPQLAARWEQPSQTEYLFKLASGVKWHDKAPANARELTAQDIVYSLERVRTDNPQFLSRSLLANVDRIEAVDRGTVRVTTKAPDVTVLANLADDGAAVLAPEVVERAGKFATADTVVGTGAFIVRSADDTTVVLSRNPAYWKPGLPYLDTINVRRIPDSNAQWSAFLAGQLDFVVPPGGEVKNLLPEQGKKYNMVWWKDHAPQYLWVNTQRKPFDDPRVYRALRLLMDHKEMISGWVEVWFGPGSGVYTSHLPHVLDFWDLPQEDYVQARTPLMLEWKQPKDDAAREALSLLNAAGFNAQNPLKFQQGVNQGSVWSPPLSQLAQDQWKRLSNNVVQSELRPVDNTTLTQLQVRGEIETSGPVARVASFEPDHAFTQVYHTRGAQNYGKYSDPRLDQMIERQRTIFDRNQRQAATREIVTYMIQNAPYTSPCSRDQLWATQLKVKGFEAEPGAYPHGHQYESVWLDT